MKFLLLASSTFAAGIIAACATDNGQTVYGDQFPPNSKVDASQDASPIPGGDDDDDSGSPGDGGKKDAGPDAKQGPCGTVAVLAGDSAALTGATQVDGAAWSGASIGGGAAKGLPKLVAFGTGFLGATWGAGDALQTVSTTGPGFGAVGTIGQGALKSAPGLTVTGTKAHVVYAAGSLFQFFHGSYDGAAWSPSALDEAVGSPQAVGNSSASIAPAGADLAFVQAGTNNGLYFNQYTTTWDTAVGITGAGAYALAAPAMLATPGNTHDLVVVFAEKTSHKIQWTARKGGAFSTPVNVNDLASTTADLTLARVGTLTMLLAFRGEDDNGYVSLGTENGDNIAWGAPTPLVPGGVAVDSTPAVASGVCGDDGIVVFATGGVVKATRLRGSAWSPPETVTGATGTRVAAATRPNP